MRVSYGSLFGRGLALAAVALLVLSGCTALTRDVLVNEAGRPRSAAATHCSGSEWADNSMIAVVPLPIISYASPTQEINGRTRCSGERSASMPGVARRSALMSFKERRVKT
jgi:hypothetical protein